MTAEKVVLGLFDSEDKTVAAIHDLQNFPWSVKEVFSPIPGHRLADALKLKKSRVGYFTLAGAIIGFFFGFWLAAYASEQWHLIVAGKPVVALIPFFIVGFELTILFGVVGNVLGLLFFTGLPTLKIPDYYDARCSGEQFGIAVACSCKDEEQLASFFRERGADIKPVDE